MWCFFNVDSVKDFIKRILYLVIGVTIFLAYVFTVMHFIAMTKAKAIGDENLIILCVSNFNTVMLMIIPAAVLFLIFIYFKFKGYSKASQLVPVYSGSIYIGQSRNKKTSKTYNITFLLLITLNVLLFFYFINDYTAVYKDRIERKNIVSSKNISYSYKDIKEVSIGSKMRRGGGSLYYVVNFNDNKKINLAATNLSENNTLYSLLEIDNLIKENNLPRKIDKRNFYNLVQNLGEEYVKKYEELFKE